MQINANSTLAAIALNGAHYLSAEMLYQPRPADPRARAVFDYAFRARLAALDERDGLLLLVNAPETAESVAPLLAERPQVRTAALAVNPAPLAAAPGTPAALGWDTPEAWQPFKTTDRWARLLAALDVAAEAGAVGWLALPAQDAVYGRSLLDWLETQALALGQDGLAAVSPGTPFQHYPVPDVRIPPVIIDALNNAFNRDETLPRRLAAGQAQGVWGKMSLIPRALCAELPAMLDTTLWEDDKEIDRALRERGVVTRGLWVRDPALYHQSPPVFDRAALKAVIERTLHYSLNIPAAVPAGSSLLALPYAQRFSAEDSIWYYEARQLADTLIAECLAEIAARVARWGASWVDWGAYRYVARVGDPGIEVWRRSDQAAKAQQGKRIKIERRLTRDQNAS
ncbi:MAG TPA: hypothetical protein VER79_12365 [Candidatus Limnocylindrales bacterium]|nr:hypothetical protein [Candidatus Limnocylindrales bacterium]